MKHKSTGGEEKQEWALQVEARSLQKEHEVAERQKQRVQGKQEKSWHVLWLAQRPRWARVLALTRPNRRNAAMLRACLLAGDTKGVI